MAGLGGTFYLENSLKRLASHTVHDYRCRIKLHDRFHLELKTRYPVPETRGVRYSLDLYIFSPSQLRLSEGHYGVKQFLEDLTSYTRYSSPRIRLARLVDPECTVSPLTRIRAHLNRVTLGRDIAPPVLLYELRTLVNIYRAERNLLLSQLSIDNMKLVDKQLTRYLPEVDRFIKALRDLHVLFLDSHVTEELRTSLCWADESISLITETECYKMYSALLGHSNTKRIAGELAGRVKRETAYRKKAGYASVIKASDALANENVLYRQSFLKKWSQSAMYMSTEKSSAPRNIGHVVAAIAAATAMSFAVVVTLLANRLFAGYSVPWALMVVVAYIFKDRIKETLRGLLQGFLPRLFFDRARKLIDPAIGRLVGISREAVRFCSSAEVPLSIRRIRGESADPLRASLPPENVMHFNKTVKLNGRLLRRNHTRLESITQILRFNVTRWLRQMDSPLRNIVYMKGEKPALLPTRRVYHLHLVVTLESLKTAMEPVAFRYTVFLTRKGILRIEREGSSRAIGK